MWSHTKGLTIQIWQNLLCDHIHNYDWIVCDHIPTIFHLRYFKIQISDCQCLITLYGWSIRGLYYVISDSQHRYARNILWSHNDDNIMVCDHIVMLWLLVCYHIMITNPSKCDYTTITQSDDRIAFVVTSITIDMEYLISY